MSTATKKADFSRLVLWAIVLGGTGLIAKLPTALNSAALPRTDKEIKAEFVRSAVLQASRDVGLPDVNKALASPQAKAGNVYVLNGQLVSLDFAKINKEANRDLIAYKADRAVVDSKLDFACLSMAGLMILIGTCLIKDFDRSRKARAQWTTYPGPR